MFSVYRTIRCWKCVIPTVFGITLFILWRQYLQTVLYKRNHVMRRITEVSVNTILRRRNVLTARGKSSEDESFQDAYHKTMDMYYNNLIGAFIRDRNQDGVKKYPDAAVLYKRNHGMRRITEVSVNTILRRRNVLTARGKSSKDESFQDAYHKTMDMYYNNLIGAFIRDRNQDGVKKYPDAAEYFHLQKEDNYGQDMHAKNEKEPDDGNNETLTVSSLAKQLHDNEYKLNEENAKKTTNPKTLLTKIKALFILTFWRR